MSETPAHRGLADLSPKHREMVRRVAAAEGVTETVWIERMIDRAGSQAEETVAETFSETLSETVSQSDGGARGSRLAEDAAGASLHRSHHAAAHATSADQVRTKAAGRVHRDIEIEREVEIRSRLERDAHAEHDHRARLHRGVERPELGVSDYHQRIAARAAAAEDLPASIWLEQVILERTRLKPQGASETPPPGPPPTQPQAPPSVEPSRTEPVVVAGTADRSRDMGLLAAAALGAVLTALLFLTLAWMRTARPLLFVSSPQGAGSAVITATLAPSAAAAVVAPPNSPTPPPPSPAAPPSAQAVTPAPPLANLSVTTIVESKDSLSRRHAWRPRPRSRHVTDVVMSRSDSSAYAAYATCGC